MLLLKMCYYQVSCRILNPVSYTKWRQVSPFQREQSLLAWSSPSVFIFTLPSALSFRKLIATFVCLSCNNRTTQNFWGEKNQLHVQCQVWKSLINIWWIGECMNHDKIGFLLKIKCLEILQHHTMAEEEVLAWKWNEGNWGMKSRTAQLSTEEIFSHFVISQLT